MTIAILGATGCIGTTLIKNLQKTNHNIIASYRDEQSIPKELQKENIKWKQADLNDTKSLKAFLNTTDVLIYLVHALDSGSFEHIDNTFAKNTAHAAKQMGVKQIIYMGVLTPKNKKLSQHLATKQKTGEILALTGIPVAEIRISILLATCSASYQMLTTIAKRFPILIGPTALNNLCSPIGVTDVVAVIVKMIDKKTTGHEIIEIGSDVMSYKTLIALCGKANTIVTIPLPLPLVAFFGSLISNTKRSLATALIASLYSGNSIPENNQFEVITGRKPIPVEEVLKDLASQKN